MAERPTWIGFVVGGAVAFGWLACVGTASQAVAAGEPPVVSAPDPHDFAGLWMNDNTLDERLRREGRKRLAPGESDGPPPELPRLTPEYQAIYARMRANAAKLPVGFKACTWEGVADIMGYPYPFEMLLTPGRITMIFEADSQVRRIWLGRDKHLDPDDLDPSYYGDSIGHWDGEVLIIDMIGFNTETTVRGEPHSDQMHISERIRHTARDTIQDEMTITDPAAFARPFTQTFIYSRRPGWRIHEYSCNENNRDVRGPQGPPPGVGR